MPSLGGIAKHVAAVNSRTPASGEARWFADAQKLSRTCPQNTYDFFGFTK
jgi:hypothetical protein